MTVKRVFVRRKKYFFKKKKKREIHINDNDMASANFNLYDGDGFVDPTDDGLSIGSQDDGIILGKFHLKSTCLN